MSAAVELELFTHRFAAVARQMGEMLQRTAVSTNVKERLDFSCGLLDAAGELVVNAPHIPVHLGALGLCVRTTAQILPMEPGDVVVTNHPAFGGYVPDADALASYARAGLESWISPAEAEGLTIERRFVTGTPFVEIIADAKKYDVDLIVIGTHGRNALVQTLMGSSAERVVRKAPCPVLTVRSGVHPFEMP